MTTVSETRVIGIPHRCGVCWQVQLAHGVWFRHVVEEHGATVGDFGMQNCWGIEKGEPRCPGIKNVKSAPGMGKPRARARMKPPAPFKAKDGTTYTPVPLPLEDEDR